MSTQAGACLPEALASKSLEAPWPAIAEVVGPISRITAIGSSRSTFAVAAERGRFVVKEMSPDRDPDRFRDALGELSRVHPGLCPAMLAAVRGRSASWYGLFEWVEGERLSPDEVGRSLRPMIGLLGAMRGSAVDPGWPLEARWLERVEPLLAEEPAASVLLSSLRARPPEGPRALAHGDFSVQNLVRTPGGLVLIDWEELGSAAPGFDAGWMLAHARLGITAPRDAMFVAFATAEIPERNLRWFEALGLLRLLFRARTLPIAEDARCAILGAVRRAIAREVEGSITRSRPRAARSPPARRAAGGR